MNFLRTSGAILTTCCALLGVTGFFLWMAWSISAAWTVAATSPILP